VSSANSWEILQWVNRLRESVRSGHFPQAMILAGPKGAGKYTLALMLAQAVNCLHRLRLMGCRILRTMREMQRIAESKSLEERVTEAVATREDMATPTSGRTPHPDQTHPMCSWCPRFRLS